MSGLRNSTKISSLSSALVALCELQKNKNERAKCIGTTLEIKDSLIKLEVDPVLISENWFYGYITNDAIERASDALKKIQKPNTYFLYISTSLEPHLTIVYCKMEEDDVIRVRRIRCNNFSEARQKVIEMGLIETFSRKESSLFN